ncbi:MAG: hypothetical protein HKM24_03360 [Gammaproteobacteria bacterium]|nr:hypothetical protein [Gammaproteobacteria bacterium]
MKKVYLIDGSVYVFRAYFSVSESLVSPDYEPTNAVYGYTQFLVNFLRKSDASHVAVYFDESFDHSFRNEIDVDYKANRDPAPDDLIDQFHWCRKLTSALGVANFASRVYEADDLIASWADKARRHGYQNVVVSRDKDLLQIIKPNDRYWDYGADEILAYGEVKQKIGVHPEQVPDFLALVGDPVDNIAGVPGIGVKTAVQLLERFVSLEGIFENVDVIATLPMRRAKRIADQLIRHEQRAFQSLQLATVAASIPLRHKLSALKRKTINDRSVSYWFNRLGFGDRLRQQVDRLV